MSRNFVEEEYNILYPRVDWRGDTPGYVESEFPIYQFLVASLYQVFGIHEWIARLLTIAFSLAALVFLYLHRQKTDPQHFLSPRRQDGTDFVTHVQGKQE